LVAGSNPARPISILLTKFQLNLLTNFLDSRRQGLSPHTLKFYQTYLYRSLKVIGTSTSFQDINKFLDSLRCSNGGKHAYYRALRAFYNWLYSPKSNIHLKYEDNPIFYVDAPKVGKRLLPYLTVQQFEYLLDQATSLRDKSIIALFVESGLRLSELANIKTSDIDWQCRTIKVLGKGCKEGFAPFGNLSEHYLKLWLNEYKPKPHEPIWGMNSWGITSLLRRLKNMTGLPCSAHAFRRTFATLLRKAGLDCLTIKDLGRWESIQMVQTYTRSVDFHDSLKFYKSLLSEK